MTLHNFLQNLQYRWKAMGRHGIHSPFVYDYIEQVLRDTDVIPRAYIRAYPLLPLRFENILSRTAAHYHYDMVADLGPETGAAEAAAADMLVMDGTMPNAWPELAGKYFGLLKKNGAVAVQDIHATVQHTAAWNLLCARAEVRLSIDLFGIGLLFFSDALKEKQHFILRH